ncbi:hypothetical protein [Glutamicibacter halophytocola]|uniref:Uncharacterized protein n=1 Tax=Glutamicibacter halophytocola TaxID=1933880 RepID=A0AA94Y0H3_9MICC|nr:hypothetical protein [Glutamicibacter halophytocola]UUX60158.1 hypothetical protein NUH22_05980 [Glutamicibacter halophytocola]
MSWLKVSDVSAEHPVFMRVLELDWADDRLLNELWGWVGRCATRSAAFDGDYVVEVGTAKQLASLSRYKELLAAALYCGLFEQKEFFDDKGIRRAGLKLVEEQDLFHMILKSEKERNKNREADNRKPERSGPVRKRDGDECRWCGVIVRFSNGAGGDQKSARVGTIDHLDPRDLDYSEPTPVERLVVACKTCNSSRKDGASWDRPLRPAPDSPYYSKATAEWLLDKCGYRVKVTEKRRELFDPKPVPASEDTTAGMPDWARPASDDATDTSGSSSFDSKATAAGNGSAKRRELFDPKPVPAIEDTTAGMPDWARPASDDATDTSGSSSFDSKATAAGKVERHAATEVAAHRSPRSHSDLMAFPAVPEEDETVETPAPGETPAATSKASANTDPKVQQSSPTTLASDQPQIKNESVDHHLKIKSDEGGGSGSAGSGREGSGRAGSGRVARSSAPIPVQSVDPVQPRARRRRPRRRKGKS